MMPTGEILVCPECSVPLVYFRGRHGMQFFVKHPIATVCKLNTNLPWGKDDDEAVAFEKARHVIERYQKTKGVQIDDERTNA